MTYDATRKAGLAQLQDFAPRAGGLYAAGRNTERGPGRAEAVSRLSPYLRRRLITEREMVDAALALQGDQAGGFVEQVVWRSYFKGWLEQHPTLWADYLALAAQGENRIATESGLARVYRNACAGRTGIDCFDAWAEALVAENWLHNHARMWFASIWIFTLRLPWALGAAFFMRHLLDGDPASNTLSWRWVAGLHTRGKNYVARAENIARYTDGRFDPRGQLDEAPDPLTEAAVFPKVALPVASPLPTGRFRLLLHDEDLCPETLGLDLAQATEIAVVATPQPQVAEPVAMFIHGAREDTATRLGRPVHRLEAAELQLWLSGAADPVFTPWAPVGPTASMLQGHAVQHIRRHWDSTFWPHATRGYFPLRQRLPELLQA